jgi:hypothetical protein
MRLRAPFLPSSARRALLALAAAAGAAALPAHAQLRPAEAAVWHQGSPGVAGDLEPGDRFGLALATGDFDGDGRPDLAIGAPGEDVAGVTNAGAVNVLYQGSDGIDTIAPRQQLWQQGDPGLPGLPAINDYFGAALTAGDFDGDGFTDLAIGASEATVDGLALAGAVRVLYGSATGLVGRDEARLDQNGTDAAGTPLPGNATHLARFGRSLASADFDGDGFADLAIGIPYGVPPGSTVALPGAVQILYGSADGLRVRAGADSGLLSQLTIGAAMGISDRFGTALAAADFDRDGFADLAIGAPNRDQGAFADVGQVVLLAGTVAGLGAATLPVALTGVAEAVAAGSLAGSALTAADVDGDGYPDLVYGSPGQPGAGPAPSGRVRVLYGQAGGLTPPVAPRRGNWAAEAEGVLALGTALTAGDFDADGHADVIASGDGASLPVSAGALAFRASDTHGPAAPGQALHQGFGGVPGTFAGGELFGYALAAADLTGDGVDDLVVGTPRDSVDTTGDTGTVTVIPGAAPTCTASTEAHCLAASRFRVSVEWETPAGATGVAKRVTSTTIGAAVDDSGLFWFFAPANWEMLVKIVDGCGFNDRFWVFAAATTNVGYTLRVEDTRFGTVRTWVNPVGAAAQALADTSAFATCTAEDGGGGPKAAVAALAAWSQQATARTAAPAAASNAQPVASAATVVCVPSATTLCLGGGRFALSVDWETPTASGTGKVVELASADSGLFWFFAAENWELLVKVLDGCAINQHFWVFSAATTNVAYELEVRDLVAGTRQVYRNEQGTLAAAVNDTSAFGGCKVEASAIAAVGSDR